MTVPAAAGGPAAAAADEPQWRSVQWYGGAMQAQLPARFTDVSDVRPVPDHQEVWSDPHTDESVIIEIAEHSGSVPDDEAGAFVFADLASANEASSSSIASIRQLGAAEVPHLPPETYATLVTGQLVAAKARDGAEAANTVLLLLALLRLPQHGSDILVSVHAPLAVAAASSAAVAVTGDAAGVQARAAALMRRVLASLRVHDWGLFGG